MPVPIDSKTGKRTINGQEFFYDGWEHLDSTKRNMQSDTRNNLFPPDREASLDAGMLRKVGMSKMRMTSKDALFFWQLSFPIASSGKNGIDDNPRMPSYEAMLRFTDTYAVINRDRGGSEGHTWTTTYAQENVRWHGIIMQNKHKAVQIIGTRTRTSYMIV